MRFMIVGGDQRHEALARRAEQEGHRVDRAGDGGIPETDEDLREKTIWVLPILSLTRGCGSWSVRGVRDCPVDRILGRLRVGDMLVFADLDRGTGAEWAARYPFAQFVNLLEQERFVSENAILTAEGALCLAAQQSRTAFWGSQCLVLGYGHIGRVLSGYLQAMGAAVHVSARNDRDLSDIRSRGLHAVHTYDLSPVAGRQDFIFNTVPARVIDARTAALIRPDTLILDLASTPYGADEQLMENTGRKYGRYPGIPGKMYPVTAGRIIYDQIMIRLQNENGIETQKVVI